jgi:NADH dehydrogenase
VRRRLENDSSIRRQPAAARSASLKQGRYVARLIQRRLAGRATAAAFRYFNKGNLATVGRNRAVAEFGKLHISGFPAWFTTSNRGARLITGGKP